MCLYGSIRLVCYAGVVIYQFLIGVQFNETSFGETIYPAGGPLKPMIMIILQNSGCFRFPALV